MEDGPPQDRVYGFGEVSDVHPVALGEAAPTAQNDLGCLSTLRPVNERAGPGLRELTQRIPLPPGRAVPQQGQHLTTSRGQVTDTGVPPHDPHLEDPVSRPIDGVHGAELRAGAHAATSCR